MAESPELDERTERILMVAMELAEQDGFDNVRLRDLAAKADMALGTVYRRFSCKEDILAAALDMQVDGLHRAMRESPITGDTAQDRLATFFDIATRGLGERPKLAAAMLRTVASGVPELAERVTRFHGVMTEIILMVYRGESSEAFPTEEEQLVAHLLQNVWFASLVGWTGGMHDLDVVTSQMKAASRVIIRGVET